MPASETSPTARALLTLELIRNSPGITARRLADRLGVSERAARRYTAILREAGVPLDAERGPHGGYRMGRGARPAPLSLTTAEALALVMAARQSRPAADGPPGAVDSALGKLVRVLPTRVAAPAEAMLAVRGPAPRTPDPAPGTAALLVGACAEGHRLRLAYRTGPGREGPMEVDPWAVVVREGLWYLLCWSHTRNARRVLRVDRILAVDVLPDTFGPPAGLDPVQALEEHLAAGWEHPVDVVIDAPPEAVAEWLPRSLGGLEPYGTRATRLVASTGEPDWYARRLTALEAPFHVRGGAGLRAAVDALGRRLREAAAPDVRG